MKTIVKNCRECGKTFNINPDQQEKFRNLNLELPARCPDCRAKKRQAEYIPCKECGVPFPFSELDREYYERQGFQLPKRCPECRAKRREAGRK